MTGLEWQRYEVGWPETRDRYDVVTRLARGQSVLHVACGYGLLCWLLRHRRQDVVRVVGADISRAAIDELDGVNLKDCIGLQPFGELHCTPLGHLPFGDVEFDTVVLFDRAFQCDVQATAGEALRVLKQGGRLVVNVTASANFPTLDATLSPFSDAVSWTDGGKLHDGWLAWGDKR